MTDTTAAGQVGAYIAEASYGALPGEVVRQAKYCILDTIGVAVDGATYPWLVPVLEVARFASGPGPATIISRDAKLSPPYAAYVNATFAHGSEFDDAHFLCGHPGAHTVPVALALAADGHALPGKDLITAVVAGYQAGCLAFGHLFGTSSRRGWHASKIAGVFAAAGTAAKIMHLCPSKAMHSIAIAASDCSGTMEFDRSGGEVKRVHVGLAARAGLEAAYLADHGLTGPATALEGARGVWHLFGGEEAAECAALDAARFYILDTAFKLEPVIGVVQAPLSCLIDILNRYSFESKDVESIEVTMGSYEASHCSMLTHPTDAIGAQLSLSFALAIRLVRGTNDPQMYADPTVLNDQQILQVADLVCVKLFASSTFKPLMAAAVTVTLKDGRSFESDCEAFPGHPLNPASSEQLEDKFLRLAAPQLSRTRAEEILHIVRNLDKQDDLSDLVSLLGSPQFP